MRGKAIIKDRPSNIRASETASLPHDFNPTDLTKYAPDLSCPNVHLALKDGIAAKHRRPKADITVILIWHSMNRAYIISKFEITSSLEMLPDNVIN